MENNNYKRYLASREWGLKREAVRKRSKGMCERCRRTKARDVHHLTYERIGDEHLDDLQHVCGACHEFLSGKSNTDPNVSFGEVLCFVNKDRLQAMLEAACTISRELTQCTTKHCATECVDWWWKFSKKEGSLYDSPRKLMKELSAQFGTPLI